MIKKNIRGYSSRDWYVAVLLFGGIIALCSFMIASLSSEYGNTEIVDSEFNDKYNKITEFNDEIDKSLQSLQEDPGIVGATAVLFKASFAFINFLLNTLGFISAPTQSFINDFDVPSQVAGIIFTVALPIITITLIIRILSAVTQRRF